MLLSKGFRNLIKVSILLIISLLFMTCDPGLGKAVDTQAPKVSINFPTTKSVLKGGFVMKGTASDEVKVESCTVTFKNIKTSQEYNFNATVSGGEFKVNINTPKTNGTFELPDGDYNVTVSVTDAYHKSTADVVYTIDNTSPTVLLTSPNIYVESNWPSMYKLFTIKGEVYDFTTISEVRVFIVDSEGLILDEKVAEGTNTFLASFEEPSIPTGKTCFYYAVAKDAGGNENTYCYHKQDIYALISQQQKNSTFPSINAIGYVDQKVEDTFNGSIDNQLLGTKKIENVKPGAEKGSRPGFDFFDKDTAQIKWLNISEESLAGIGIGTPVLGTIMPPTDGSAVLDVEVWVVKSSDGGTTFEDYSDANKIETGWVAEGSEEKQCKLNMVGDSVNIQIDSHDVGSGDEWPSSVYKVKVKYVTNSDMEGYAECVFQVTSGAPKLTEGTFSPNPNASYYRGFMTAETLSSGKNYLKGISKTSDEASAVSLVFEVSGSSTSVETAEMDSNGNYEIEIPIDAENHSKDGEYTYTLTSKVSDILSTVISRVVVIDTTKPVVNFTNLTNEQVVPSKDFVVRGNVEDANGISKVEYKLYADDTQILLDGTSSSNGWILLPGVNGSFDLSLTNLKKDVNYELKIRTTDAAGNTTGEDEYKRQFTLDNTDPEIKVNSVSPQIEYEGKDTVNGNITVNLSVTDTNTIKEFYYTFDNSVADDSNWSAQGNKVKSFDSTSGVQKLEIDTTKYADGSELPLRIKAVDEAGNTSVVKVNPVVNQESDKPSISPSNFDPLNNIDDAGWQGVTSVNVFGKSNPNMIFTVADDDLVKEYYAKLNDGQFKKIGDVNSAQKIVTYPLTEIIENYERHKITLRIVDDKYVNESATPNNFVEEVFYVAIDDGQPELRLNNTNGQFVGEMFTISGTATDGNGIECVTLQSEGGNVYSTLGIGSGFDNGTFTYTFRLNDLTTKDPIIVTAVDKIGNTSSTTFTYYVDSTPPTVEIKKYSGAIDGNTPQTRIEGTAKDENPITNGEDISKIDLVRLRIDSPVVDINDENSVLATGKVDENGIMTWSAVLDFNDLVNENESKTFTVYAAAFDFAGNMSEQKTIQVSVDGDVPVFDHEYTNNNVGEKTDAFDVFFNVTDSSGIENILVSVQGYDKKITLENLSNGDYKFTVPKDVGDGHLSIVITATDKCKKTSTLTLTATLDSKSPVLEFTNIEANGSTKQTNSSPVVNISYSDETSGVAKIEYKFLYKSSKDEDYKDFKEYSDSNAKGTIDLENVTSGSLKIFMAGRTSSSGKGPFIDQISETDGEWKVWYQITDAAGHKTTDYSPVFIVDRHAPVLEVIKPIANELKKENDSLTVEGTVIDDFGGTIDKVVVQVNHSKYDDNDRATFTKTFTKEDGLDYNSNKLLYDWAVTWDEINSPFKHSDDYEVVVTAYDTAENQYEIKNKVSCDNSAPEINFMKPYSYSVDSLGNIDTRNPVNSPMGVTTVTASIKEFKMESIFYQIGGTVKTTKDGNKFTNISVENGGIQSNEVGNDVLPEFLSGIWKKLGDANNGFTADVDTLKYVTEGKTVELLDNDPNNDKNIIQTLEIHLVALDDAGNINYCAMPILVDTDTDKPELLVLSPKIINSEANVGGTTTISGTVNDDNNVHSVWMNVVLEGGNYVNNILTQKDGSKTFGIDYSQGDYGITSPQSITIDEEDKTFSSPVSDSAYFKDSTKWYKVNLTEQAKSTTWNLMLNKDSEFDITKEEFRKYFTSDTSTLEETTLKIRVIALDKKDNDASLSKSKLSEISTFTLKIDSGSPSIVINNIQDVPVEGSYIGGNIDFDLTFTDDGLITFWSVVAKGSKGEYTIASGNPNQKSVRTTVTMDTAVVNEQCGNVITLKIYAEDNSKDGAGSFEDNKTSEETFKYTIDNTAPVGSVVETIDGKSYMITTESVVGDSTGAHRETDDRGNHLRIKSASALLSGKVNDETNGSGVDYVMLYFTKKINGTNYIFNPGNGNRTSINTKLSVKNTSGSEDNILFPVASFADVKRNNNSLSTTNYIIVDKAEGLLDNGSNGDGDGYDENLKSNGEWMVTFDSSKLPDGVYEIFYVVVDIAGNARYYKDFMLVQNSAPFISSVVLSTDIDGDGSCDVTVDGDGDEDNLYDSSSFDKDTGIANTDFVVRNNVLKIRVNVIGGTDPLKFYMTYKDSSGTEKKVTGTPDVNNRSGIFEISSFPSDGSANYVIWVEDTVENDISLSSEIQTIKLTLDNIDDVAPVAQLYELNTDTSDSNNRGSLFKDNGKIQGHIEPRANSKFVEGTPDISGKIILRGEALDDQQINSIVLNLNGTETKIATWDSSKHILVANNGAVLVNNELGLYGHYVEWSYVWNTNDFVGRDVIVSVTAKDATSNSSGVVDYTSATNTPRTENNMFSLSGWGYNDMTVDVVPYITGLDTTLSKIEKRNSSVYGRSALGKYPVYYYRKTVSEGKESEKITVQGFNILSGSTVTFEGGATTSLDVNKVFTLPEDAKSGEISVSINGISSINNTNDNNAIGTKGEYYNQKPNGQNNDLLTDDVDILIWEINSKAAMSKTGELSEVMMHVNPANGMLGFAFAHSQDLASYPKGNESSYQTWMTDWTGVNQIGFVYDQKGNMFGTNGGTDTYTPSKKTGRLGLISSHWGIIADDSKNGDWYTGYTKYHRLRLEYLGMTRNGTYASNVYRFAKGDSTQLATTYSDAKGTNLYMLYYDNTLGELKFKAGNFGNAPTDPSSSASGEVFSQSGVKFGDFADDAFNQSDNNNGTNYLPNYKTISIVANQNGAKGNSNAKPGIYYSVDAIYSSRDQSDVVVAVWYDDVNKTLWYSYLVNPLDKAGNRDANGAISTEWATPIAILDGHAGGYNAIKVDDAGHIHIAAYSRNDAGSLYYAYLNSYDADYNENENLVAVDAYGSTGQYITMEVANNGNGKYIPYIGYYMSSMSYPKYAYLVDTESAKVGGTYYPKPGVDENSMFTGAWETVLLPTTSTIVIDDINIGVYKNSDGTLKSIPKQTESVGVKNGIAGGNETPNPIFAYGISQTGSGYIETAQLK